MASPVPTVKNNLQNGIRFRKQPKFQWEVIEFLGSMGGGLNAGIAKVRTKDDPLGRVFIEKRFNKEEILYKIAQKEMALLYQVGDHPFITRMVDHFVDERTNKASIYMEFCDMGSLNDVIEEVMRGQRVNEHKVWQWLIQSMEALVYCHRGHEPNNERAVMNWARIYHRDIKPGNILLTRVKIQGRMQIVAKLADFGCAQSDEWTSQTKPETLASHASAHTPGFDQPEFPKFSGSSDVWQMALVFVCICGLRGNPRSKRNPTGTPWNRDRPAGLNYSVELSLVLMWCLTEDANKRPGTLDVLKRLKEAYNGIKTRLPSDNQPLEIFEHIRGQYLQMPPPTPFPIPGQQAPPGYAQYTPKPDHRQHPRRPGPPGHVMSDPEAGRIGRMPNSYTDFVNGRRFPGSPSPGGHSLGRPHDAMEGMLEDDDEDDIWFHNGIDPSLPGGFHPHRGYFPPFHPAQGPFGRRF